MKDRLTQLSIVLVIGMMLGYVLARGGRSSAPTPPRASFGTAVQGELMLGDFERDEDFSKLWETNGVVVSPSTDYATSGRQAAKLVYRTPPAAPAFMLEDYFGKYRTHADWTGYRYLAFDVFNPDDSAKRLVLQLKDAQGHRYKQNLSVPPQQSKTFSIYLSGLSSEVDLHHIEQLNFFMWKPRNEVTLFLDRVRLLSSEPGQAVASSTPAASASLSQSAPAAGASGPYMLCDFESEQAIGLWEFHSSTLEPSTEHVTGGQRAGKLEFYTGQQSSAAMIEDPFSKGLVPSDWSGYHTLRFSAYSDGTDPLRFVLQLKDGGGKRFKKNLTLPPREATDVTLQLSEARGTVNVSNIQQLNLFLWKPRKNATMFLDDVQLEPKGGSADGGALGAAHAARRQKDLSARKLPTPHQIAAASFETSVGRWQQADASGASFIRAPIVVVSGDTDVSSPWPITGGVPFAMGQLRPDTPLRLVDERGQLLPLQWRPLATWEDGSIRWAHVETQRAVRLGAPETLFLEYGAGVNAAIIPQPAVTVSETAEAIAVQTGPLRFTVSKRAFDLFHDVWLDADRDGVFAQEERVSGSGDLSVTFRGTRFLSSRDTQGYHVAIEERGPLKTTLRASGWFRDASGQGFGQFIVRLQAFAGRPYVRMYHTFIYTGYPENMIHFKYQGLRLPENETIQEIALALPLSAGVQPERAVFGERPYIYQQTVGEQLHLLHRSADSYDVRRDTKVVQQGTHLDGWVDALGPHTGVMVAIRDAWQQFPKGFIVDASRAVLSVQLWPEEAGALDLRTTERTKGPDDVARGSAFGLGKTHELLFHFHPAEDDPEETARVARTFQATPQITAHPQWIEATGVLGSFGAYDPLQVEGAEPLLEGLFDWAARQVDDFGWYGMLDFGDTLSWYRKNAYDKSYGNWGWHPEGRWGWMNAEGIGNHTAVLMQFLRTAQPKYFHYADRAARHIMDVDTVHYNTIANDPRLRRVISDEYSRVGSMHRHSGDHWGGRNEETSHTNLAGFLLHYYATGYQRSLDVAKEVGDFFLGGHVTYSEHPDIAPQRSVSNVAWGLTLLYEATWERRYLEAAERWIQILIDGQQDDGSWADPYDPTTGQWRGRPRRRFMVFQTLPALIAYHRLTGSTAVGEAIVRGTEHVIANEKYLPWLDAAAYSYQLTGDEKFLEAGDRQLRFMINAQNRSGDPRWDGMIYNKAYYERIFPVLSTVPALLGAEQAPDFTMAKDASLEASAAAPSVSITPAPVTEPVKVTAPLAQPIEGLAVSVVPSLEKVFRDHPPQLRVNNPVRLFVARNEFESAQLLLESARPLKGLRVAPQELVSTDGQATIDQAHVSWRVVDYVKTRKPGYDVERVGWWPDPLVAMEAFDVAPEEPQTIWLTLDVPDDAAPGLYRGTVLIREDDGAASGASPVQLEVRVWDFALPKTPSLKSAFDLYSGRLRNAYKDFVPEGAARWGDRWEELEDRYYEAMVAYRLSPILNADLTNPEDVARVEALLADGMSSFGIGSHTGSHGNNWPKDAEEITALEPAYRQLGDVLRARGWQDRAYIYTYDEPNIGKARVTDVATMVRRADATLRNLVTLHKLQDIPDELSWFDPLDIVAFRNVIFNPALAERLRATGKELWLYVSGPEPPYPTLVIDYPAMSYRILPWMCWKYRLSGLLYWCVNFWTTNPWENPMNTKWSQNGNGSLFYPGPEGPVPSIRLEVLRDGMEDYEYLAMLQRLIDRARAQGGVSGQLLAEAEALATVSDDLAASMRQYTRDASVVLTRRLLIGQMIERVQSVLNQSPSGA